MSEDGTGSDDSIEVVGLSELAKLHLKGTPSQRFAAPGTEPDILRLTLRYRGQMYEVIVIGTIEAAQRLGYSSRDLEWMRRDKGWWASIRGTRGGRFFSAPFPTAEAAILAALLLPRQMRTQTPPPTD